MSIRVGIIGAGPSGMAQLRAFEAARKQGAAMPEITCFEKQSDWGGQWNYSWHTGIDGAGESAHSSMYRHLWSNGPKECLEFADYTFDEHFGRPISSFPPRAVLFDYISGRVEKSDVRKYIRFNTAVRWVNYDEATEVFTVESQNVKTGESETHVFDKLVVSTGHFSVPNIPEFEGINTFPGEIMHAHDFRGAERFAGKDLLMIGSSYSAEDIGMQAHKMGAASVTLSYRSAPMGYDWPSTTVERPLVTRFEGRTAHFADGTSGEFDAVVLCTGYLHKYPFLPSTMAISSSNVLYPGNLYKGVVWQQNTNLFYLGAQDQYYTFNMFDAQAWFARDVMVGKIELPSAADRSADISHWLERQNALNGPRRRVRFPDRLRAGAHQRHRLPGIRSGLRQRAFQGLDAPQERRHPGVPRPDPSLGDHRHDVRTAPYALDQRHGRFPGTLPQRPLGEREHQRHGNP